MPPKTTDNPEKLAPFHRPNLKEELFFLFSGMAMSVPFSFFFSSLTGQFLERNFPDFTIAPLLIVVAAPILEEFAKVYPLFYRHCESQKSIVRLGFLAGLGFGIVEFFLYVFVLGAPISIRLPAILFHGTNTSIVAYGSANKNVLPYYILAVLLHALVNFGALLPGSSIAIPVAAILTSYVISFVLMRVSKNRFLVY